ncbi:IS3 family transposase [Dactylosporangium sp. CA-139066]|uniref:IS3 family transposase n=1 Tax=Dactylosporangium sp. CA-139066 TaxID=3239930 RepID=UPI003D921227
MIDDVRTHAGRFGVEPILAVLNEHGIGVAPSTYYAHAAAGFGPTEAELRRAYLANRLFDLWSANRRLYGRRKLWIAARRAGLHIGRDQVERLMKLAGIDGVRRGRHRTVTTTPDRNRPRHLHSAIGHVPPAEIRKRALRFNPKPQHGRCGLTTPSGNSRPIRPR